MWLDLQTTPFNLQEIEGLVNTRRLCLELLLPVHETSPTLNNIIILNNANLCTPKKVAKNNDRAASVAALVHAHAHAHARAHIAYPGRSCDSFNQIS